MNVAQNFNLLHVKIHAGDDCNLFGRHEMCIRDSGNNAPGADLQIRQTVKIGVRLAQQVVQGGGRGAAFRCV